MSRGGFSRSWVVPIGALLVLAVGVGAVAVLNYRAFDRDLRRQVEGELAAVADLKVQQIAEWRQQLLADVGSLLPHPVVRGAMVRLAAGRPRTGHGVAPLPARASAAAPRDALRRTRAGGGGHLSAASAERAGAGGAACGPGERWPSPRLGRGRGWAAGGGARPVR